MEVGPNEEITEKQWLKKLWSQNTNVRKQINFCIKKLAVHYNLTCGLFSVTVVNSVDLSSIYILHDCTNYNCNSVQVF